MRRTSNYEINNLMTPEDFIQAYQDAFGADTQLPIAFGYSDEPMAEPKEGLRCLMGLFPKVRKGDTVTLADKFISCGGGMLYMGTGELQDRIPNFVSNIEHYQQTPQMVRDYVEGLHIVTAPKKYINFVRVDKLSAWEGIEGLIFFAKPDVLSGLCAWAFFDDNTESAVITRFASGCASLITMAVSENRKENGHSCFLGGFDPSARIMMPADEMTFVIPAIRLDKMLQTMKNTCLFDTPAWSKIKQRIENEK